MAILIALLILFCISLPIFIVIIFRIYKLKNKNHELSIRNFYIKQFQIEKILNNNQKYIG